MMPLLSAALAAASIFVLTAVPIRRILPSWRRGTTVAVSRDPMPGTGGGARGTGPSATLRFAVGVLAGIAAWAVVGGVPGAVLGAGLAVFLPLGLGRMESADSRRRRARLVADAPLVAELLAAAMAAGVPLSRALPAVARAAGGACEEVLLAVHARCELGEPAGTAWKAWQDEAGIGPLARAVARSERTGAPVADVLRQSATDLRHAASRDAQVRVRRAGVQAVLPLGLCLLPAFALLGIVPTVAALAPQALP